jgi:purine-binding chemotaxis protein CheW
MVKNGGSTAAKRLLVCRAGAKVCGFPLEHVIETMRPLPVEPLAGMPGFVLGVALIRGRPTPVVDTCRLLGSTSERSPQRYVTLGVEPGGRSTAFALDNVLAVRDVDPRSLSALPGLFGDAPGEVVRALGALDAELFLVLEHARLLPDAVWDLLDAELRSA